MTPGVRHRPKRGHLESTPSTPTSPPAADDLQAHWNRVVGRRGFLIGVGAAGATALTGGALAADAFADSGWLSSGDAAILRFLAAAELLETDLWQQYAELGGVNGGNPAYIAALENLDGDMPQYISRQHRRRGEPRGVPERLPGSKGAPSRSTWTSFAPCRAARRRAPARSAG